VIQADEVRTVLDPLPVSSIFGVGPRTAKRLEAMGVHTVGELAARPREEVLSRFGSSGAWIHDLAHGIDPRRVSARREEKSYSIERTFATDLQDREELRLKLFGFCEELAFRLRDHGLRGRTVSIKARFWNFKTVTRSHTLDLPTNLAPRIWSAARGLLDRVPPGPLRLLGVAVSGLDDVRTPVQGQLFASGTATTVGPASESGAAQEARLERTAESLDKLRRKFGPGTVVPASLLGRPR
jgi:DNA polymerase-4